MDFVAPDVYPSVFVGTHDRYIWTRNDFFWTTEYTGNTEYFFGEIDLFQCVQCIPVKTHRKRRPKSELLVITSAVGKILDRVTSMRNTIMIAGLLLLMAMPATAQVDTPVLTDTSISDIPIRIVVLTDEIPNRLIAPERFLIETRNDSGELLDSRAVIAAPYTVSSKGERRTVLVRNREYPLRARGSDTIILLHETDPSRAALLVEVGRADMSPVGEEDFGRLLLKSGGSTSLRPSKQKVVHYLSSSALDSSQLEVLQRAIHRRLIVRFVLGPRGIALGAHHNSLPETLVRQLSPITLVVKPEISRLYPTIINRIVHDLENEGLTVERSEKIPAGGAWVEYTSRLKQQVTDPSEDTENKTREFSEAHGDFGAPLFLITPYWLMSRNLEGFEPVGDQYEALLPERREQQVR